MINPTGTYEPGNAYLGVAILHKFPRYESWEEYKKVTGEDPAFDPEKPINFYAIPRSALGVGRFSTFQTLNTKTGEIGPQIYLNSEIETPNIPPNNYQGPVIEMEGLIVRSLFEWESIVKHSTFGDSTFMVRDSRVEDSTAVPFTAADKKRLMELWQATCNTPKLSISGYAQTLPTTITSTNLPGSYTFVKSNE